MKKIALFLAALLLLTACSKDLPVSLTQAKELTSSELTALGHSGVCETYTGPYSSCYRNPDGSKTVSLYGITENWCAINSRWETLPSCDPTPAGQVKVKKVQSLPVAAAQAANTQEVQQDNELEFLPGDLTEEELQTAKLTESDTPEVVDDALIQKNEHVNRLWEQEDALNTIVFQNKNGSKTMYIYAAPVKYKDETGKVKDKKNKLSEQDIEPELAEDYGLDYGLTNPENDVRTYFPKKLNKNKGVVLQYGDVKLEVSPLKHHKLQEAQTIPLALDGQAQEAVVMANEAPGQKKKQNKTDVVEYNKVFGKSGGDGERSAGTEEKAEQNRCGGIQQGVREKHRSAVLGGAQWV